MNKRTVALILAICLLLTGCAFGAGGGETDFATVYRIDNGSVGRSLVRERIDERANTVEEMLALINSRPEDSEALASLPEGVSVSLVSFSGGIAKVEISPEYLSLSSRESFLAEGAVTLSLSTLDCVCFVDIVCGEEFIGRFCLEDFVEADAMCGGYERTIKLYLPGPEGEYILPRSISLFDKGEAEAAEMILYQLFKNIGNGMENTEILSVSIENGVCRVDLSEEFYGAEPAGSIGGMVIIYSMVNSLCRLSDVNAVHIKIEGNEVSSYGGFMPVWPLAENMSLVRFEH